MLDEGIRVRVDLILGLPGDTVDSVRRGLEYLDRVRPSSELQVFVSVEESPVPFAAPDPAAGPNCEP